MESLFLGGTTETELPGTFGRAIITQMSSNLFVSVELNRIVLMIFFRAIATLFYQRNFLTLVRTVIYYYIR